MKRLNRELPVNPHQRPWRAKHRKIGQPEGHWTRSYGISRDASSSAKRANQAPTPCRCARRAAPVSPSGTPLGLVERRPVRPCRALAAPIGHLLGGSMKQSSPCNEVDATGADSGGAWLCHVPDVREHGRRLARSAVAFLDRFVAPRALIDLVPGIGAPACLFVGRRAHAEAVNGNDEHQPAVASTAPAVTGRVAGGQGLDGGSTHGRSGWRGTCRRCPRAAGWRDDGLRRHRWREILGWMPASECVDDDCGQCIWRPMSGVGRKRK